MQLSEVGFELFELGILELAVLIDQQRSAIDHDGLGDDHPVGGLPVPEPGMAEGEHEPESHPADGDHPRHDAWL